MQTSARLGNRLQAWDIAGPVALVAVIALGSGAVKWRVAGMTADTLVPLGIGAVLLVLTLPALFNRFGIASPARTLRFGAGALTAVAVAGGAYALQSGGASSLPSLGSLSKISVLPQAAAPIEGRAAVLSADTLRVNGTLIRLAGIDAPEKTQSCLKDGKRRWRCGEAAIAALEKRARSKTVRCTPSGSADAQGRLAATCTVDGADIAADLVKAGHVFSASTMIGGYSAQEGEAKKAASGLWSGEAERPAAYRSKTWDDAKKTAPDGCPIKAVSTNGNKVYLLPWSSGYKSATVRTAKGDRWFCSEGEATSAGFKPERA